MENTLIFTAGQIMAALWIFSGFNFRKMGRIIAAGVIGLALIVVGIFNRKAFEGLKLIPQFVKGE